MPTQEDRITALEQKTAMHIQEMDENFTIKVGVIRLQGQDIKRIFQRLETIDESLLTVNQRLDTVDEGLHTVNQRLGTMDLRLDTMDESLLTLKQQFSQFETIQNEHTSLLSQILERLT